MVVLLFSLLDGTDFLTLGEYEMFLEYVLRGWLAYGGAGLVLPAMTLQIVCVLFRWGA